MIEQLKTWDTELFLFLNSKHSVFWDFVMYNASNKFLWVPLYLVFAWLLYRNFGKKSILILVLAGLLIVVSDQISVHFFKNIFQRLRPCHDPQISDMVHLVKNKCGGQFGFYSGHATNHFALATFLNYFFRRNFRYFTFLIFLWASLISYSRIYLGVHFPGDVITGALAGSLLALLFINLYKWIIANYSSVSEK